MKQNDSGHSFLNPLNNCSTLKMSSTFKKDLKTLLDLKKKRKKENNF